MKTMRIIDLLKKNANGEELPKKIKLEGQVFELFEGSYRTCNVSRNYISEYFRLENMLNDEVEIIEDKPSKIEEEHDFYNYASYNNNKKDIDKILYIIRAINKLEEKYSTIAKAVNYLLEKSDSNE